MEQNFEIAKNDGPKSPSLSFIPFDELEDLDAFLNETPGVDQQLPQYKECDLSQLQSFPFMLPESSEVCEDSTKTQEQLFKDLNSNDLPPCFDVLEDFNAFFDEIAGEGYQESEKHKQSDLPQSLCPFFPFPKSSEVHEGYHESQEHKQSDVPQFPSLTFFPLPKSSEEHERYHESQEHKQSDIPQLPFPTFFPLPKSSEVHERYQESQEYKQSDIPQLPFPTSFPLPKSSEVHEGYQESQEHKQSDVLPSRTFFPLPESSDMQEDVAKVVEEILKDFRGSNDLFPCLDFASVFDFSEYNVSFGADVETGEPSVLYTNALPSTPLPAEYLSSFNKMERSGTPSEVHSKSVVQDPSTASQNYSSVPHDEQKSATCSEKMVQVGEEQEDDLSTTCVAVRNMQMLSHDVNVKLKVGDRSAFKDKDDDRRPVTSLVPYVEKDFSERAGNGGMTEVQPKTFDPANVKCFMNYLHSEGDLTTTVEQLQSLLKTWAATPVEVIFESCFRVMFDTISSKNALSIRSFVESTGNTLWKEKVDRYISRHFDAVCLSDDFLKMPFADLKVLARREDLNVKDEKTLLKSFFRWIKASEADRRAHLPELLRHIHAVFLPVEYISKISKTEELIRSSPACRKVIAEGRISTFLKGKTFSTKGKKNFRTDLMKGTKFMGYGLYTIHRTVNGATIIHYYNAAKCDWYVLYQKVFRSHPNYVVCTEEKMYFIGSNSTDALQLSDLRSTHTQIEDIFPTGAGITLHAGKIYLFGSILFDNSANVLIFCPESGRCFCAGTMRKSRADPGVASLAGYIYVTGGYCSTSVRNSSEKFNPETGQCTLISPMRVKRYRHNCAAIGDKILVCGGCVDGELQNSFLNTAEVYNIQTDQWSSIAKTNRAGFAYVSLFPMNNCFYMVDAEPDSDGDFQVGVYDPSEKEWEYGRIVHALDGMDLTVVTTNFASRIWR